MRTTTKRKATIPKFKSEDDERTFWAQEDSARHLNWDEAVRVRLPKLQPSAKRAQPERKRS